MFITVAYHEDLSSARAFSSDSSLPSNNSRHVILVLWYVHVRFEISRYVVNQLEICEHAHVGPWHDALGESGFTRGEAVTSEFLATRKRSLYWIIVDEVGTATLKIGTISMHG